MELFSTAFTTQSDNLLKFQNRIEILYVESTNFDENHNPIPNDISQRRDTSLRFVDIFA